MASEYKVGTISAILASQASENNADQKKNSKKAAKLQALFGGVSNGSSESSSVYRTVKITEAKNDPSPEPSASDAKPKKKKKLKDVVDDDTPKAKKLANKNGIEKRVRRERKPKEDIVSRPSAVRNNGEVEKKVKKKKESNIVEEEAGGEIPAPRTVSASESEETPKKKKGSKNDKKVEKEAASDPQAEVNVSKSEETPKKKKEGKKVKVPKEATPTVNGSEPDGNSDIPKKKKSKKNLSKAKKDKLKVGKENKKKQVESEDETDEDAAEIVDNIEDGAMDIKEEEDGEAMELEETTAEIKTFAQKNAPKPKNEELERRTVFVGNLPQGTEKRDVKKIFKKFGKLETVRIRGVMPSKPTTLKKVAIYRKEHNPDKSTVNAYVRFSSREEAKEVVNKARGMLFKDHHLIVDLAVPEKRKNSYKTCVYVGNLDYKLTEEELWRFFEDCGQVASVRIIRDSTTGAGKGFGYVTFMKDGGVDMAMRKNNQPLRNREIRIRHCIKKEKVKKNLTDNKKRRVPSAPGIKRIEKAEKKFETGSRKGKIPVVGKPKKEFTKAPRNPPSKINFSGDKLAEIGKLKRKSNKPNRGELRRQKIARLLTQTNKPGK